jgi:WD40-like Beta Propeller Repeat
MEPRRPAPVVQWRSRRHSRSLVADFSGRAAHSAAEFLSDFGNARAIGITDSGTLYYKVLRGGADIFVAPFDPASGQIATAPLRVIRQFNGLNQMPEWSANGKYLAYVSKRDPVVPSPGTVVISSLETAKVVRELRPKLSYLGFPRWSPDGRMFVARGADLKGRSGIVKFDAMTGEASLVVPEDVCSGIPVWAAAADGTFFCFDFEAKRILQVDVASSVVRRVMPSPGQAIAASSDGRFLVHGERNLALLSLSTGESRELLPFGPGTRVGNWATVTFTPDNRHVILPATSKASTECGYSQSMAASRAG